MSTTATIGVLMRSFSGYYWGGILMGIHQVVRQRGAQLRAFQRDSGDTRIPLFAKDQIDGWIIVHYSEGSEEIVAAGIPLVTVATSEPELGCPAVMADNVGGTQAAVRHLIEHGHQRIAFIGNLDQSSIQQRYQGYLAALAERGLPIDPQLVIGVEDNLEENGTSGAQQLIDRGLPCTAIFAATDRNAIGALAAIHAAGYRVPQDVAVAGFDDINAAQFATPPLTTVRTRFETFGIAAAELVFAQLNGQAVPAGITAVPATLIVRQSCGCNVVPAGLQAATQPMVQAPSWQDTLTDQLLGLALAPQEFDLTSPPAEMRAALATLVRGLASALAGTPIPSAIEIARAWSQLAADVPDLERLYTIWRHLSGAGSARLTASADYDAGAARRQEHYSDQAHVEMLRARLSREMSAIDHLEHLTENNYQISLIALNAEPRHFQQLSWLKKTWATWGCLGLYPEQPGETPTMVMVAGAYDRTQTTQVALGQQYPITSFPPPDLVPLAAQAGGPDIVLMMPIKTATRDWGILALCAPVESHLRTDRTNTSMWAALIAAALERKSLLAEIAEQQDTLSLAYEQRLITENIRDLISMLEQEGHYLYASPSYRTVLGYSPAELSGITIFDLAHQDDLPSLRELWSAILTTGTAQGAFRARHANGEWRWLEVAGTAVSRQGVPSVVTVSRDITERRRLEADLLQSQKMESIGRLAGGVAHDFNNMLTAIGGYADLALETLAGNDDLRGDLLEIQKATMRAANLTRQLLTFARKQIMETKVLNLNDLILDTNKLLRRVIGEDIDLITLPAPDLGLVKVDRGQIEQVLVNLAVNARDAMPRGGKLTIETFNIALSPGELHHLAVIPGPYVLLIVSDTGVGMSAEVKQHLFEPFFTTKAPGQGTGLGLATCYGIVKQHGGYIWPYSEPGQGTTLKIYLPRVEDTADALSNGASSDALLEGNEVVLLVEDEAAVRALAARVLRKLGYTVLESSDGKHALALAQEHSGMIALLLTDVVMPHMGGKQLADQLTAQYPSIKVLFMSGYTDNTLVHGERLGAGVEFLHKPFTPAALARKVRGVLDS